jgi:hypothetical protein
MSAVSHGLRKGIRTALQLIAGGALTALVDALAHGLAPATAGLIMGAWTSIVAATQNGLEQAGKIPTVFPTTPPPPTP